ncbi:YicC/YloC family endoribonuclease [Mesorhizobium xinjiangense]|uniref:YicC/YloC family endoribonuclease n=1 Tax=Mesorhizobium xinjiangense TaxID=2678685 RepID=UPI0012EDE277|nr:YicC/YloC family endoribonuclease [Mesorhizobium xinjiangense]
MAVQSMTGFARAAGEHDGSAFTWELRSVNGRGLEARVRLPQGFERLELAARQAIQKRFSRGNVQANLSHARVGPAGAPVVNEAFLKQVADLARHMQAEYGCAPPSADGLLALKGVLETPNGLEPQDGQGGLDKAVMQALDSALDALETARCSEGTALAKVVLQQVERIEALTQRVEKDPSREPEAIRERLAGQIKLLSDASDQFDEQRLHMEAVLLASKADIREEIDRLKAHVAAARSMLDEGGTIGRRLDFLAQEFGRESNTLCAKSNAASVTAIGLELKVVVDQLREQVQNLE